jgi:hypothetical protein
MPLQSLSLLNSEFMVARAGRLAELLAAEHPADEAARLVAAFVRTCGRPPTEAELAAARSFLHTQPGIYSNEPDGRQRTWRDLCHMLLANNAFLYLD